jgi:hypothetical protein
VFGLPTVGRDLVEGELTDDLLHEGTHVAPTEVQRTGIRDRALLAPEDAAFAAEDVVTTAARICTSVICTVGLASR